MKWKRWLFKYVFLIFTTILMTFYMTRTIGTMYIEELNKEFHISNPTFLNITNNQTNSTNELLTPEKLVEIKQHMSTEDKVKIYSLITSKLPQSDIQNISSLIEDGLTKEKLNKIQKILNQYLNEQEYSELISIFSKY
ncbi:hypothetical protein SAMN04487897_102541 [Paenibacillus sp. yr247]|uniref:hypothetical protein n=1 Tax=Paenibacillus sp. yr247 TaxID=1761880 RepID=UPI000885F02C|nr:hypothetical protein [Paenibacillus sp. yr247]SDN33361.1 hypothetical protein SAMN04487897_102541 [Paenibacillus sp. yr247]